MNYNQITGILRALVPAAVAYLVGKGYLTESSAASVIAAVIALLSAGWSVQTNSDASAIKTVAAMPDVKSIVAVPNPSDGMAAAVKDSAQPKVVQGTTP